MNLFRRKQKTMNKGGWYNITVDQFTKVRGLNLTDMDDQISAAEILLGFNADNMTWKEFCEKTKELDFLSEPIPETIIRKSYEINGRKYNCLPDVSDLSVSRFMDFQHLAPTGDMVKILAVFLIPDGKEYGEDLEQVYEDIKQMNIVEAYGVFNFFKLELKVLLKTLSDYSVKLLKKDKQLSKMVSEIMDYWYSLNL